MSDQAVKIAACCLHDPKYFSVQIGQTEHRLKLASQWPIHVGSSILEIGCGQGDCTAVLASIVGSTGHVTVIDPADLSYGSPYTLGQAQEHLKNSPLGAQIVFKQANVLQFLSENHTQKYDTAVLAHCVWYFTSPKVLQDILEALKDCVQHVCIAEYALSVSSNSAFPHLLSAFAQNALFLRNPSSLSNIRTVLSSTAIIEIAEKIGLHLLTSDTIIPSLNLLDGYWEAETVKSNEFLEEINEKVTHMNEKFAIYAMRDAMMSALETLKLENKEPSTMNVWTGVFSTAS